MLLATLVHEREPRGTVLFRPDSRGGMEVEVNVCIPGMKDGDHGFHIHEYGDTQNGCASTGGHYNPSEEVHGSLHSHVRHAGDFGNLTSSNGCISHKFHAPGLSGDVAGRGIVLHALRDDLGRGGDAASRSNGNAGARLACGSIVHADSTGPQ